MNPSGGRPPAYRQGVFGVFNCYQLVIVFSKIVPLISEFTWVEGALEPVNVRLPLLLQVQMFQRQAGDPLLVFTFKLHILWDNI
jgi:hypothetical protein